METREKVTGFNKALFLQRIELLIAEKCNGDRPQFNQAIGQRSADYRWRTEKHFPRVEALVKICNHFGVSMDWLLGLGEDQAMPAPVIGAGRSDAQMRELLIYYREVADHYRALYGHARHLLDLLPRHGQGVEGQEAATL